MSITSIHAPPLCAYHPQGRLSRDDQTNNKKIMFNKLKFYYYGKV